MTGDVEHIPFQVDVRRIIEVLAKQIYQSPMALLRENAQNAFDAILLRRHEGQEFEPRVDIEIEEHVVSIADNGIGMTPTDLREHYWHAGSSSKNNPKARQAGVVGTFGIGAMANFGIAEELTIETESALTHERTISSARKDSLSTTEESISLMSVPSTGEPGTKVTASVVTQEVDVSQATSYITEFVAFVDASVYVNGELVSQRDLSSAVSSVGEFEVAYSSVPLSSDLMANVLFRVAQTGEIWVRIDAILFGGEPLAGEILLRQGMNSLRTFRSGFGLATVSASSYYQLGGVANLAALEPTAGREALTTESMQLLQTIISSLDEFVSLRIAERPEADTNTGFMEWVRHHERYDLCGNLQVRVQPANQRRQLASLREESTQKPLLVYSGSDTSIIDAVATDDTPLIVLASQNPRRKCETEFLNRYCQFETVEDSPTVLYEKPSDTWTIEEQAVIFRVTTILSADYFLETEVLLGKLSHGLSIVADLERDPAVIFLDPEAPTFGVIQELYRSDYDAFASMTKDFVRNVVFPRVAERVPSSTRQGAEAFLKTIRRTRDVFEYERSDLDSLSSVWSEYLEGHLSMQEAADRATFIVQRNVQVVDSSAAQTVRDVVPDVIANEEALGDDNDPPIGAAPPIVRTQVSSDAKLLTIDPADAAVKGYRCFIALSDRTRDERGEFFLQPHSTSIVWGGQKVLFVFEHHSGEFGLYYDLQTPQVVAAESGGGPFPTATIVLKDRIYVPIPEAVMDAFIPAPEERKRFEVRSDLLFTEKRSSARPQEAA